MRWKVFYGALNARGLVGYMKRLARECKQRILLVLDNWRAHHSRTVRKWLKDHEDTIVVHNQPVTRRS